MTLPARRYPGGVTSDAAARLDPADRELLDNVIANAALEGQAIPVEDQELAVAYLAGDIDAATYRRRVRDLALADIRPASQSA